MMTMKQGLIDVNGARIYHELRGSGPPLLLIVGLTGDAGWFEPFADLLAEKYTIITYDRRGNSRSPRPKGWTSTSVAEQADDAAGLLSALHLAPALVFGNSFGATIALELLTRHPQVVRGAIAHEPFLPSLLPNAQNLNGFWQAKLAKGGPRYAMTVFTGMKEGESIYGLDLGLVRRVFGNGDVVFLVEIPASLSHLPDVKALKKSRVPIVVAAGEETSMFYHCSSRWVADQLETDLHELPGDHDCYAARPKEFAEAFLALLEKSR
jgi:pimeloyl-ACP methyl ester carboxylesterase